MEALKDLKGFIYIFICFNQDELQVLNIGQKNQYFSVTKLGLDNLDKPEANPVMLCALCPLLNRGLQLKDVT